MKICSKEISSHTAGRYPVKQQEIYSQFAHQVKTGILKPGDKLPIREQLIPQYNSTSNTIQRSIDMMVEDGLLVTIPRKGTFVAEKPSCLYRYAVVFSNEINDPNWRGLDSAIYKLLAQFESETDCEFFVYDGINTNNRVNKTIIDELETDISTGRLAGVFYASNPYYLEKYPSIMESKTPSIAIKKADSDSFPIVNFNNHSLINEMVDHLVAEGCKNIAMYLPLGSGDHHLDTYQRALTRNRLVYDQSWVMGISFKYPQWINNHVQLLLGHNAALKPDGLIVMDDTLAPYILNSIEEFNLNIENEIKVISHANMLSDSGVDTRVNFDRMGFNIRELIEYCLKNMRDQFEGKSFESCYMLEPFFRAANT